MDYSQPYSLIATINARHEILPQTRAEQLTTIDQALESELPVMNRTTKVKLEVKAFEERVLRGGTELLSQCRGVVSEVVVQLLYQPRANF
jgi:hypothetical protein